jgi:hypothetical protein
VQEVKSVRDTRYYNHKHSGANNVDERVIPLGCWSEAPFASLTFDAMHALIQFNWRAVDHAATAEVSIGLIVMMALTKLAIG